MNFQYDEEQDLLRDAAKKLLADKATLEAAHKQFDAGEAHDQELWKLMAENGWQGIAVPEEYGGSGMGYLNLSVIAEEIGYYYANTPFTISVFGATEAILLAGSESQKGEHLPKLAAGEAIGTLAIHEADGRYDLGGTQASVKGGKLSGVKIPVCDGTIANLAIVSAKGAKGVSLYLVDLDGNGVSREEIKTMELCRKQARITFKDAPAELLGKEGQGEALYNQILDRMGVLVANEQLGGAQRSFEMARDYAKERYAFGRPIGSYQAIKHRIVDMFAKITLARSNCMYGAWALQDSPDDLAEGAALARVSASDAYLFAAQENVQIHGGIGFTWQADPHLFLKRMKHLELLIGSEGVWRERLFQVIEKKAAA